MKGGIWPTQKFRCGAPYGNNSQISSPLLLDWSDDSSDQDMMIISIITFRLYIGVVR